jgi:serpin B
MIVIVPQHLGGLEQRLHRDRLDDILGRISDGGVHLSLPRFTAETHLGLVDTLAAMGMPSAFGGDADFSGMTGRPDLFVQAVEHEAVVSVDEDGTQAAAASGGAMAGSHGPTVTVDRPFLFLIRDEPTGAILFLGRVTDPR